MWFGLTGGDYNGESAKLRQLHDQWQTEHRNGATKEQLSAHHNEMEQAQESFTPMRKRATMHMLLGLFAVLVTILVQSIAVTYFVGTGRWCKEVVETYGTVRGLCCSGCSP